MQSSEDQEGEIRMPSSVIKQSNRGKQYNGKEQRSLQENQRYKGNISCKDGPLFHAIKDKNGMDRKEVENIKRRWQEYTDRLYNKDLHDPNNHDAVIPQLEPDILECEVSGLQEALL